MSNLGKKFTGSENQYSLSPYLVCRLLASAVLAITHLQILSELSFNVTEIKGSSTKRSQNCIMWVQLLDLIMNVFKTPSPSLLFS